MTSAPTLFSEYNDFSSKGNDIGKIRDLVYRPNFLSALDQENLLNIINNSRWLTDIKRRVQHYGWKYDYKARTIDYSMYLGNLPEWALNIAKRLYNENYISEIPDQLIVNEYMPGQGIANHVDCKPCFSDTVISISLGSKCVMDFINIETKEKIEVLLEPMSLVVIKGDSRYKWSHGIPARKMDFIDGIGFTRKTRISLTFRKVIINK